MRALVALLLLAPLLAPHALAAPVVPSLDVRDATGDSRAFPDVRLPQTDIARFTMELDGAEVVQTVHVVGPWPDNDYWVQIRNDFGFSETYTMKLERMNSSGSNARPTDYNTSLFSSLDPAKAGKRVAFNVTREGNTMTFRWPAAEIPADAKCLAPRVTTLSRTTLGGRSTQVDDDLDVRPTACASTGARAEGLDGTCPAPVSRLVVAGKMEDGRDDAAEREGLAWRPHANATLDILALETRLEDGWVVQTVTFAEPSPRDMVQITIENQYRGNQSEYDRGAYVSITLFETAAGGSVIGEGTPGAFHVRAERAQPAGWELRWCASLVPADATCFAASATASLQNGRYQDRVGAPKDPCPAADGADGDAPSSPGSAQGSGSGGADDTDPDASADEAASDTPGPGTWSALAALAACALALRRRA